VPRADAVLVGADAVAEEWFVNKCGTGLLAAAASFHGVPVYVLAGREKLVADAARLELRSGPAVEVWESPPAAVEVRNPYFERVSARLATAFVSDAGVKAIS
jgi:translation initiation factor 2B subunit (eIF-2B alpha/beta/delta family)